jgi:hypothetical protein
MTEYAGILSPPEFCCVRRRNDRPETFLMENATLTLLFTIIHYVCVSFDLVTPAYLMLLLSYYGIYEMSRSLHLVNIRYYERIKEDEMTQPDNESDNDRSRDETVAGDEADEQQGDDTEDDNEDESDTDEVEENDTAEDGDDENADDEKAEGDTTDSDMPPLLNFADTRPACNGNCAASDRLLQLLATCAADIRTGSCCNSNNCCSVQTDITHCDASEQCSEQHLLSEEEHEEQEEQEEHEAPPAVEETVATVTEPTPQNPPIKASRTSRSARGGRGRGGSRGGKSVNLILQEPVDI